MNKKDFHRPDIHKGMNPSLGDQLGALGVTGGGGSNPDKKPPGQKSKPRQPTQGRSPRKYAQKENRYDKLVADMMEDSKEELRAQREKAVAEMVEANAEELRRARQEGQEESETNIESEETPNDPEDAERAETQAKFLEEVLRRKGEREMEQAAKSPDLLARMEKAQDWFRKMDTKSYGLFGAAYISAGVIGGSFLLGHIPRAESAGIRLASRVGIAMGLNTALGSSYFKQLSDKQKKYIKYGMMAGGVGAAFMMGGGVVAAIAAGGMAVKRLKDYITDSNIKRLQDSLQDQDFGLSKENLEEITDPEKFHQMVEETVARRAKAEKALRRWQVFKNLAGGATAIGAGLATMEAFDQQIEQGTHNPDSLVSEDAENLWGKAKGWFQNLFGKDETPKEPFDRSELLKEPVTQSDLINPDKIVSPQESTRVETINEIPKTETPEATEIKEKTEFLRYVKAGDGVTQTLKGILDDGEAPAWFSEAMGENPTPKDWANFAEKIGAYSGAEVDDSLVVHSNDQIGFNADGDIVIVRGDEEFTLAKAPETDADFSKGDWEEKMQDEKFMNTRPFVSAEDAVYASEGADTASPVNTDDKSASDALEKPKPVADAGDASPERPKAVGNVGEEAQAASTAEDIILSPEVLEEMNAVHTHNLEQVLKSIPARFQDEVWNGYRNQSVESFMKINPADYDAYRPILETAHSYIGALEKVSELRPLDADMLGIGRPENIEEYINRALRKIASEGRLDEVRL